MNDILKHLNEVNDIEIKSVFDTAFLPYGKIIDDIDFSSLSEYAKKNLNIPKENNIYVASDKELEKFSVLNDVRQSVFGNLDIQCGYCNGKNTTYNGFEYHKMPEVNIAVTDFCLVLGKNYDIAYNTYEASKAEVFFVPKNTAIEMYGTTLHLSPCRVSDEGFIDIVILPLGTNTPLKDKKINTKEDELLLQNMKWIIAHKDREPLVKQGAHIGFIGENKEIKY